MITTNLYSLQVQASPGEETASALTAFSKHTRADCGKPSAPAFLCSGVMLRDTNPSTKDATFWTKVFNELKTRGVEDVLIAVTGGLKDMPEALAAAA